MPGKEVLASSFLFVVQSHKKRSAPKLIHDSGEFVVPACKLTKFDLNSLLEEGDSPHEDAEEVLAEYWLRFAWLLGKLVSFFYAGLFYNVEVGLMGRRHSLSQQ